MYKKSIQNKTYKNKSINNERKIYQDVIKCFMHSLNTIKLYHWKTTNYATHKATDQLYSDLNNKIDEFVEVMLGKPEIESMRNNILNVNIIKLRNYKNNNDFKKEVEYYKQFLINLSQKKEFMRNNNSDLLAIRDEILALFNQFLYLLTLKN